MSQSPERTFADRLASAAALTQERLAALLTDAPGEGEHDRPERLVAAMRHALLAGGKRFRPFLLIETAALFGVEPKQAVYAAAAIECLHTYSLVHDDLPAMDDDATRRGIPTVHVAFDEATAILAGDALLTLAFDMLSRPSTHPDPGVRVDLCKILARASGAGGMVGGQMLDLQAEGAALDEAAIRRLQAMKTGALIAAACHMGARLGGADLDDLNAILDYGRRLGLAFQIADDLLDVESTAEALGKAAAKDADRGKATLVALLGPSEARNLLDRTVEACVAALTRFGPRAEILAEAARFAGARKN